MSTSASNTLTGSCFCGNVAYEVTGVASEPVEGIICHCRSCQKLHTMVSYNAAFGINQLKVTKGTPSKWDDHNADSGFRIERNFCGNCGSALFSYPDSKPEAVFVKAGTLDEVEKHVKPAAEIYIERLILGTAAAFPERKTTLFEGMMAKQLS